MPRINQDGYMVVPESVKMFNFKHDQKNLPVKENQLTFTEHNKCSVNKLLNKPNIKKIGLKYKNVRRPWTSQTFLSNSQ